MDLLFRANASTTEKTYTLAFLVWMGIAGIGTFWFLYDFIPSPQAERIFVVLSALIGGGLFVPFLLDRHPANRVQSMKLAKRFFLYGGMLFFSMAVSWFAVTYGIFAMVNTVIGNPTTVTATVIRKGGGRSCGSKLIVSGDTFTNSTICVRRAMWSAIDPHDRVRIRGQRSFFGLTIRGVDREEG